MLRPFIQEGYEKGEEGFRMIVPRHRREQLQRFEQRGIEVREAEHSDQIESRPWEDAHLWERHHDSMPCLP